MANVQGVERDFYTKLGSPPLVLRLPAGNPNLSVLRLFEAAGGFSALEVGLNAN